MRRGSNLAVAEKEEAPDSSALARRKKRSEAYEKLFRTRPEQRGAGDGIYAVSSRGRNSNETPEEYSARTGKDLEGEPPPAQEEEQEKTESEEETGEEDE